MRGAKWGVGAVVVVGVVWLLTNMFNLDVGGLGIVPQANIPSDASPSDVPEPPVDDTDPTVQGGGMADGTDGTPGNPSRLVALTDSKAAIGPEGRLDVRIAGRQYHLRNHEAADGAWVPASLGQVVAAAKQAPGDDAGIRVRMLRSGSSLAGAESELVEALNGAGIDANAIEIPKTLVE